MVIAQEFRVRVQFVPSSYVKWVANINSLILQCRVEDEILSALYISGCFIWGFEETKYITFLQ